MQLLDVNLKFDRVTVLPNSHMVELALVIRSVGSMVGNECGEFG